MDSISGVIVRQYSHKSSITRVTQHSSLIQFQDVLNFGRSGAGAPVKDSSGRVRAVVVGNPEIRFQENEGVQKSIQNAIRYHADKDFKSQYHADLGEITLIFM